jgi:hypothetical protein
MGARQQVEEQRTVGVIDEGLLAPRTTIEDVVAASRALDSDRSSHDHEATTGL